MVGSRVPRDRISFRTPSPALVPMSLVSATAMAVVLFIVNEFLDNHILLPIIS